MKLRLPHKTYNLSSELEIDERLILVNKILSDKMHFHELIISVEEYFRETWNKDNTKTCMDIIGYYLTKENRVLEVLSRDKIKEMNRGSARHMTFSALSYNSQLELGIVDVDDFQ